MKHPYLFGIVFSCFWGLATSLAYPTTYWVDDNGSASWGNCSGTTPLSGSAACSLSTANSNASAGAVVNLRAGTYGTGLAPSNSGTKANPITFQEYNNENPLIDNVSTSINLGDIDWIVVDGINVGDATTYWIDLDGSAGGHHIIKNCTIDGNIDVFGGIRIKGSRAHYNQFVNNTIRGRCSGKQSCVDGTGGPRDLIYMPDAHQTIIYGNTMGYGGHDLINIRNNIDTDWTVIKNNVLENRWHGAIDYHRFDGAGAGYLLVEGNTVYNCSIEVDKNYCGEPGDCGDISINSQRGTKIGFDYCIYRWNISYNNGYGVRYTSSDDTRATGARVYHNTHYANWQNMAAQDLKTGHSDTMMKNNIAAYGSLGRGSSPVNMYWQLDETGGDNYVVNNLFYSGAINVNGSNWTGNMAGLNSISTSQEEFSGNLEGDPKFVEVPSKIGDAYEQADETDFTLQSDSPAIDAASWLTQVNDPGGGSGYSLKVDDARYFFAFETWFPNSSTNINLDPDVDLESDTIYVDNPSLADFTVKITAVNYSTDTLTLASSQTWDDNAKVYHCPDGVCFTGSAPDIGAYEFNKGSILAAPQNLRIAD